MKNHVDLTNFVKKVVFKYVASKVGETGNGNGNGKENGIGTAFRKVYSENIKPYQLSFT